MQNHERHTFGMAHCGRMSGGLRGPDRRGDDLPKLKEKPTYKVGFAQTESNNPWRLPRPRA